MARALDGVEVPGGGVHPALGESPAHLLRVAPRHGEEQRGRARAGVAVHGDAGQRPNRRLELVEQPPLVRVHRLHAQLDPLAPARRGRDRLTRMPGHRRCCGTGSPRRRPGSR